MIHIGRCHVWRELPFWERMRQRFGFFYHRGLILDVRFGIATVIWWRTHA